MKTPTTYPSRRDLSAAVNHSLRNDSPKDFRRDLDKALESSDRLTGGGHFMGRYWAERAIADLVAIGCGLQLRKVHDTQPLYRVEWSA